MATAGDRWADLSSTILETDKHLGMSTGTSMRRSAPSSRNQTLTSLSVAPATYAQGQRASYPAMTRPVSPPRVPSGSRHSVPLHPPGGGYEKYEGFPRHDPRAQAHHGAYGRYHSGAAGPMDHQRRPEPPRQKQQSRVGSSTRHDVDERQHRQGRESGSQRQSHGMEVR
mgnify:CR=1 FL=1